MAERAADHADHCAADVNTDPIGTEYRPQVATAGIPPLEAAMSLAAWLDTDPWPTARAGC